MAILKHISVKNRFYSDAVEYLTCQFDEYTNKPILDGKGRIMERENYLIDGVNCDVDSFGAECIETNRFYGKNNSVNDVKAHHYIISFEPEDDITMEQAMEFGKKWLAEFAPGHQAVVAVHPDGHNNSRNMHIHMVINSVRKFPGRKSIWHDKPCEWKQCCKHKSTGKMMYHAKKWVMDKCIRLGLGQADLLARKHKDNYWVEKRLIPDGGKVIVTTSWGEKREYPCRFIDEYHTEVGSNLYHICEFAERMQKNGATYEPKSAEQTPQKTPKHKDLER